MAEEIQAVERFLEQKRNENILYRNQMQGLKRMSAITPILAKTMHNAAIIAHGENWLITQRLSTLNEGRK